MLHRIWTPANLPVETTLFDVSIIITATRWQEGRCSPGVTMLKGPALNATMAHEIGVTTLRGHNLVQERQDGIEVLRYTIFRAMLGRVAAVRRLCQAYSKSLWNL